MRSKPKIVVLGGAFAGLEAAFLLRQRLGKSAVGLCLPRHFAAGEPFQAGATWKLLEAGLTGMSAVMAG